MPGGYHRLFAYGCTFAALVDFSVMAFSLELSEVVI